MKGKLSLRASTAVKSVSYPSAKYLSYSFWRCYFLVMFSSPIWAAFVFPEAEDPGMIMYLISTMLFVVTSVVMSVFHDRVGSLLSSPAVIVAMGAAASFGVAIEFGTLAAIQTAQTWSFYLGAALTGIFTVPLMLKAGQIYASARVFNAVVSTLLSDVGAGLVFFFCIGTWPLLCLGVATVLPLLSALMSLQARVEKDFDDDCATDSENRPAWWSFSRFLVAAFFIGAISFLQNYLGGSWFANDDLEGGRTLGVSLLIIGSFALTFMFSIIGLVNFESLYRPIVVFLVVLIIVSYLVLPGNSVAVGGTFLVYFMFSSYIWAFMSFLAHSKSFSPIQVFGLGRGVYSGGSLIGCLAAQFLLPGAGRDTASTVVVAMVFILLLCIVGIRRADIAAVLDGYTVAAEGSRAAGNSGRAAAVDEVGSSKAAKTFGGTALVSSRSGASGGVSAPSSSALPGDVNLSPREREVYVLMRDGRDAEYIAGALCISRNTAKTHIRNIYTKFGVHRRQDFIDVLKELED